MRMFSGRPETVPARPYFMKYTLNMAVIIICFLSGICSLLSSVAYGEQERNSDSNYVFYKGNTYYEEGRYDLAAREYSRLLERGLESGNLYYNLGNCYLKMGELGRAVLNYERAGRLIPEDGDLRANYDFARSRIKYAQAEASSLWYEDALAAFERLSIDELTVLLSAVFVIIISLFICRLYFYYVRRYFLYFMSVSLMILIITSVSLVHKVSLLEKEAVVITESAEVRFAPLESATVHFTLYEGMKVEIIQTRREWAKIKRADGKSGWIERRDMEKV